MSKTSRSSDPLDGVRRPRVLVALGGNALLLHDEPLTVSNQRRNVRAAAAALAPLAAACELVISHGNGPQVGLLALQAAAYVDAETDPYPLDVLGAETEGMIGYMIEQELGNLLPAEQAFATILTMVEVDPADPAFQKPTKPIGPFYDKETADRLASKHSWTMASESKGWRRVVASPCPRRIFEIRPIRWLLEKGVIVISTGGGGIPTMYRDDGTLQGAEAVIDKDRASALLARELGCDILVLATDVDGVYRGWGTDDAELVRWVSVGEMREMDLSSGSMGPKVEAACAFAAETGRRAAIGCLDDLEELVSGDAGTQIRGLGTS